MSYRAGDPAAVDAYQKAATTAAKIAVGMKLQEGQMLVINNFRSGWHHAQIRLHCIPSIRQQHWNASVLVLLSIESNLVSQHYVGEMVKGGEKA